MINYFYEAKYKSAPSLPKKRVSIVSKNLKER